MLRSDSRDINNPNVKVIWKETPWVWMGLVSTGLLLTGVFADGLNRMVQQWSGQEEYSYGYLIPFITLFLIWQKADVLRRIPFSGSWSGIGIVLFGVVLFIIGNLSVLYTLIQYSFLIVLAGCVLAMLGWRAFRVISIPLFVLAFMIPLPGFIYGTLSNSLQLLSSQIGVWFLKQTGVSVFLEGNVVDLGTYKLQVEEACNGLRYLFPLMTFGFVTAYFFKAPFWKRAVIFLSTIPITVFMNSARIAAIGIMVDHWGRSMAEGFLHQFEGWVVFMICLSLLLAEMWLLARAGSDSRPLRDVFGFSFPRSPPTDARIQYRTIPKPFFTAAMLLVLVGVVSAMVPHRVETQQPRKEFTLFPMQLDHWAGHRKIMDSEYVRTLNFDDYILANYVDPVGQQVELYAGYYASQRLKGVPHSPRACIPGDGWRILSLTQIQVPGARFAGQPLSVNRVAIQRGEVKELVYYWFQERGRDLTSEYLVKWYLFWDALTKNRSDGALVRVVTQLKDGQDFSEADKVLIGFVRELSPTLPGYIPG